MILPLQSIAASAVHSAIVLTPACIIAAVKRSKSIAIASALTFILYMVQIGILVLPKWGPFVDLQYNWVPKLLAFLATLVAAFLLKLDKSECGLNKASVKAFGIALLFAVVCTLPALISDIMAGDAGKFGTERLLFELTMPGLQEEPFYRGLLLLIWDRAVGRRFRVFGVQLGWGDLVSLSLFTLGHVCIFDKDFHLMFAPEPLHWFDLIFFSVAMSWLRYKYNSIWPAVLAHNIGNTIEVLSSLILSNKH